MVSATGRVASYLCWGPGISPVEAVRLWKGKGADPGGVVSWTCRFEVYWLRGKGRRDGRVGLEEIR